MLRTKRDYYAKVTKSLFLLRKTFKFKMNIIMFIILSIGLILNVRSLVVNKLSYMTIATVIAIVAVTFSSTITGRDLIRDLKERRTMKKNGEEYCNVCWGATITNTMTYLYSPDTAKVKKRHQWSICKKCHGTGKIDWVQKVIDPRRVS